MYESNTTHLYPSFYTCPACGQKLSQWYRKNRTIKSLSGSIHIVSHIFSCKNTECSNPKITPEKETLLAIKGYTFGLDVILKIGALRYKEHKTWNQIEQILNQKFQLKISYREIGYLEESYLSLSYYIAKNDKEVLENLRELKGLVLAIDGIKPNKNGEILYLVREIQTGYILAAKIIEDRFIEQLQELLESVIDLEIPIIGIVSDKEPAIMNAVKAKMNNTPHQLCHYHYLKNIALEISVKDSKLKRYIISYMNYEITKILHNLKESVSLEDETIKNYCYIFKTLFKRKSLYPLKPAGISLYTDMLQIQESLENCLLYRDNLFLKNMHQELKRIINSVREKAYRVKIVYDWIYQIATFINKDDQISEVEKKHKLTQLMATFQHNNDFELRNFLIHIKNVTQSWLPNLFRYLSQPLLPKTNNNLEFLTVVLGEFIEKLQGEKNTRIYSKIWRECRIFNWDS